jgi:O-succinylbenzoate synthase
VHVYAIPLRTRFRRITVREGVLVRGDAGWGEFSPFWDYDAVESAAWWRATREAADAGFPDPVRDRIPVNVTVPAVGPDAARRLVLASGGCTTAKVKVAEPGQGAAEEADRLAAVREALGPGGAIRIDANAGWDVDTAVDRLAVLDRAAGGLEYAEQPVAAVDDLARVRRRTSVRIAADESIRRAEDPMAVVRAAAADVVVLKVQPLGGVRACLALAEQVGLPVVVSSALESSVGLAAGVALAAALPELPFACGLATAQLLTQDVTDPALLPVDGALPVAAARAAVPDPARLAATAADAATAARWAERVDAVRAVAR